MTLEIVDESDIRKVGDKEKKPELKREKKSWLDIVEESESDVREDPKIELVDKSGTRKVGEKVKKPGLEFVAKERIINCERQRAGMINNCTLCKELSRDRFDKCPNKYGGF